MTGLGHEERFPPTRLSACYVIREKTFAGRTAMGEQLCLIDDDWRGMPDGVGVSPAVAIPDHGVKAGYHFAHDRNERDLWPFASGDEAAVEGSQHRVEPDRG